MGMWVHACVQNKKIAKFYHVAVNWHHNNGACSLHRQLNKCVLMSKSIGGWDLPFQILLNCLQ